jgi:hypothetical protein
MKRLLLRRSAIGWLLLAWVLFLPAIPALAQSITIANPNWNITLTDAGYSDFLLDNTPGFEGREYLSGEWGAAVAYQPSGGTTVGPMWLNDQFWYPDWPTHSNFTTTSPVVQTGVNADGLPIAQAVIANGQLEITLRHEMIDTVVGIPMGTSPASAGGNGTSIQSNRYVLKETYTIRNISGGPLSNVQFFQFLHGFHSQHGVFDNRPHAGAQSAFRYDVTMAGVDPWSSAAGSSSGGLEDFIGFHASVPPTAYELGHYGIEGNGVDDHFSGKPSEGVHLSIENNWQTAPYSGRNGTDSFAPSQRWVSGAQRWNLGSLAAGASVNMEVLLSLVTGTKVATGNGSSGGCNGGSGVTGGLDYSFEDVTAEGSCFGEYAKADEIEISVRVADGDMGPVTFPTPGGPLQLWEVEFSGSYSGQVSLTFHYDPTLLPPGFDPAGLCIYRYGSGSWVKLATAVDSLTHTVTVSTAALGVFALGVDGGTVQTWQIDAGVAPVGSGTVSGNGVYADGTGVTLTAVALPGYAFGNWTEGGTVVSISPGYTFAAGADRTLVANFSPVGAGVAVSTSSSPASAGSTSGDGVYALGSNATVSAVANPGYKFSKWLQGSTTVSSARNYTFTVTGNRALIAKFKSVYTVTVSVAAPGGGDAEVDSSSYEPGETAYLKAFPASGYSFVNWTDDGVTVSTSANFSFTPTANRALVAHFAPGHRFETASIPPAGGSTSGDGVYPSGTNATLSATANPGYVFLNWSENGTVLANTPTLEVTSDADHAVVANFSALPTLVTDVGPGNGVTLSWPAGATDWVLQESPDLSAAGWAPSTANATVVGSRKQVAVPTDQPQRFFRLAHP